MKKVIAYCLIAFFPIGAHPQTIQWATKVLKFSSQYSEIGGSAKQVLGKPNTLGGDHSNTAWAVAKKGENELPEKAFIRVGFKKPMSVRQVAIGESFNPGAIELVVLYGKGKKQVVYQNSPEKIKENSRILNIFFEETEFAVEEVEVTLQPGKVAGWNEIDAIGISDSYDSVKVSINLVPNLVFSSEPENLGENINSKYPEVSPLIVPDGKMLYFSRKNHPNNIGGAEDADDIWYSRLLVDSSWGKAKNMGPPLNTKGSNFIQSITPDGNTLLLANVYNAVSGAMTSGISISHKGKGGWSFPKKLEIEDDYNESELVSYFLANSGKTLLLAVQRKDTYGERDLYVSFLKKDGTWSKPKNLGPVVNTMSDEGAPFLASDDVTLYFTTSGHPGYGNNDIFMTTRLDENWENWSEPQNLGPQINSPGSETYFRIPASGNFAYFTSKKNEATQSDIYRILLPGKVKPKPVVLISGKVLNAKTKQPLAADIVCQILPGGEEVGIASSDPNGGDYKIILPYGKNYGFLAQAAGYYSVNENMDVTNLNQYTEINKDLLLAPIEVGQTIRLNNIFFEFGKATLKEESFIELNQVIKFMGDNPNMEVEIAGHTDNVGSDENNLKLSQDRAQAVVNYLTKNSVDQRRLTAKGYGESKPVDSNETDAGKQMNRRVEFTILKR